MLGTFFFHTNNFNSALKMKLSLANKENLSR